MVFLHSLLASQWPAHQLSCTLDIIFKFFDSSIANDRLRVKLAPTRVHITFSFKQKENNNIILTCFLVDCISKRFVPFSIDDVQCSHIILKLINEQKLQQNPKAVTVHHEYRKPYWPMNFNHQHRKSANTVVSASKQHNIKYDRCIWYSNTIYVICISFAYDIRKINEKRF